jgi:hypothetical protein
MPDVAGTCHGSCGRFAAAIVAVIAIVAGAIWALSSLLSYWGIVG